MGDSVNIGGMWVELGAALGPFIQGMKTGKDSVKEFSDTTDKAMNDVGKSLKKGEDATKSFIETHQAGFRKAGLALSVFGAAVTAMAVLAIKSYAGVGHELDHMSERTGISAGALSELGYAADLSGSSLGGVERAVRMMQKRFGDLASASDMSKKALSDQAAQADKTADKAKKVADAQRDAAEVIIDSTKEISRAVRNEAESFAEITKGIEDSVREKAEVVADAAKDEARAIRDTANEMRDIQRDRAEANRDKSGEDLKRALEDLNEREMRATERLADVKENSSRRIADAERRVVDVAQAAAIKRRDIAERETDLVISTERKKRDAAEKVAEAIKDLNKPEKGVGTAASDVDEEGNKVPPAIETLNKLGVALADFQKANTEKQFQMIADGLSKIEDPTKRAALAMEVFGARTGTAMLPVLENLAETRKRGIALGAVLSTEAAAAAGKFQRSLDELGKGLTGIKYTIAAQLLPVFKPLIDKIVEIIIVVVAWLKEHPALAKAIGLVTIGIGLLASVLGPVLLAMVVFATHSAAIGVALTALGGFFTGILLPIAAFVAAIVAGALLAKVIIDHWEPIKAFFKGIWDGLIKGWTALGDGILAIWKGIVNGIKGFINMIIGAINTMIRGIIGGINAVINGMDAIGLKIPTLGIPQIPTFHAGGIFRSDFPGGQGIAMLQDGEQIVPPGSVTRNTSDTRIVELHLQNPLSPDDKYYLLREFKRAMSIDSYVRKGLEGLR